jgi:hypothetical protein
MALTKVLIAVKTYPTLSSKYDELVCTAGFLEDGSWVRIYPIPFRKLEYDKQYSKYDWVEIDLERKISASIGTILPKAQLFFKLRQCL